MNKKQHGMQISLYTGFNKFSPFWFWEIWRMEALWRSHWWPVECWGSCLSWQEGWVGGYRPLHQQPQLRGRAQISRSHYLLDFSWKWQNMRFEMQAYKIHQIVSIKFKVFNVYLLRNTLITFVRTHALLFSCKQIKNNIIALHPTALIFISIPIWFQQSSKSLTF